MGQGYSVRMKLRPKDESALAQLMSRYISDNDGKGMRFPEEAHKAVTLEDHVKVMITDRGYAHEGDVYESTFDASYGWESVMTDMFQSVAPMLEDGSELLVYPDEDYDHITVQDGAAVWLH